MYILNLIWDNIKRGEVMHISNVQPNINSKTNFSSVVMSPHPEKWDQRVLRAVLNSKTVEDIVVENNKIGKDTQIRYYKHTSKHYPEIPAPDDVYLSVKGEKGEIFLSSHSTYKFLPSSFLENSHEKDVYHGPKDIGKDLTNQIRAIDHRTSEDPNPHALDYLKKIATEIIYEPTVKIES